MTKKIKFFIFSFSILLFALPVWAASETPPGFADLVEKLLPSVVNISTTQMVKAGSEDMDEMFPNGPDSDNVPPTGSLPDLLKKYYDNQNHKGNNKDPKDSDETEAMSLGSGFIIDENGYIVTNYHVVNEAEDITVTLSDNTQLKAKIIGSDAKTDIALLKVNSKKKLSPAKWGDSDNARVGEWVIAIGNPFGLGGSVSAGIVSARARDINSGPFDDFLQTDAAINRGNSGGPLFNTAGEVIGINAAIFSPSGGSVGIGFAVSSSLVEPLIKQIKETGHIKRGWLGVKIQTVSDDIANNLSLDKARGALVIDVSKGSPADLAGIVDGDIILKFDGKNIESMHKLPRIVADTQIGKIVKVQIWRKNQIKYLEIKTAELKESVAENEDQEPKKSNKQQSDTATRLLGLDVTDLNYSLRQKFTIKDDVKGVLIVNVDSKSNAGKQGLQAGFVITSVNQEPIQSVIDLKNALSRAKKNNKETILLFVIRVDEAFFIALPLK